MYRFEKYQREDDGREQISDLGACADVVRRLNDDLQNKIHKVFYDNLFCSILLPEN